MELYWLLRLPALSQFFIVITVLMAIIGGATAFFSFLEYNSGTSWMTEDYLQRTWKVHIMGRWLLLCALTCGLITCFIPTKQDLALMLGWDAIKSDSIQEVIEILKERIK